MNERRTGFGRAAVLLALLLGTPVCRAITIDFESLANTGPDRIFVASGYTEERFVITSSGLSSPPGQEFCVFSSVNPRYSGSAALAGCITDATLVLAASDGSAFDALSINLAASNTPSYGAPPNLSGPYLIPFTGALAAGGTVTQTFQVDYSTFAQQTFLFSADFADLVSLSWVNFTPYHQFDNVVIRSDSVVEPPPVSVPEPGSLALLGLGLAGVGFVRRKRRAGASQLPTASRSLGIQLRKLLVILAANLLVGPMAARAAPITTYDFAFTLSSGTVLPTAGSFDWDGTTLSGLSVSWMGLTFSSFSLSGSLCGTGDAGVFSLLGKNCGAANNFLWSALNDSTRAEFAFIGERPAENTVHQSFLSPPLPQIYLAQGGWSIAPRLSTVPEPATLALLSLGLAGLSLARRTRAA